MWCSSNNGNQTDAAELGCCTYYTTQYLSLSSIYRAEVPSLFVTLPSPRKFSFTHDSCGCAARLARVPDSANSKKIRKVSVETHLLEIYFICFPCRKKQNTNDADCSSFDSEFNAFFLFFKYYRFLSSLLSLIFLFQFCSLFSSFTISLVYFPILFTLTSPLHCLCKLFLQCTKVCMFIFKLTFNQYKTQWGTRSNW